MEALPVIFRARRIALGLTQEQAAEAAGLGRGTLIAFERGEGGISLANLRRLMAAVGLELATREATRRPTFDELAERYGADDKPALRKRAPRKPRKHS